MDGPSKLRIDPGSVPAPVETLIIGVTRVIELRDFAVKLMQRSDLRVYLHPDLGDASDYCQRNETKVDLIVLLLNHPDELTSSDVEQICREWPLARVVAVGSVWLASALRTRGYYPVSWLVGVEDGMSRVDAEVDVVRGTRLPLPQLANYAEAAGWKMGATRE
jgi:hypothetical protein